MLSCGLHWPPYTCPQSCRSPFALRLLTIVSRRWLFIAANIIGVRNLIVLWRQGVFENTKLRFYQHQPFSNLVLSQNAEDGCNSFAMKSSGRCATALEFGNPRNTRIQRGRKRNFSKLRWWPFQMTNLNAISVVWLVDLNLTMTYHPPERLNWNSGSDYDSFRSNPSSNHRLQIGVHWAARFTNVEWKGVTEQNEQ